MSAEGATVHKNWAEIFNRASRLSDLMAESRSRTGQLLIEPFQGAEALKIESWAGSPGSPPGRFAGTDIISAGNPFKAVTLKPVINNGELILNFDAAIEARGEGRYTINHFWRLPLDVAEVADFRLEDSQAGMTLQLGLGEQAIPGADVIPLPVIADRQSLAPPAAASGTIPVA